MSYLSFSVEPVRCLCSESLSVCVHLSQCGAFCGAARGSHVSTTVTEHTNTHSGGFTQTHAPIVS